MALTVETGSGASDSDALITLAYADAYHSALGNSTWTGTDALKEAAIRRATAYVSESYNWDGVRSNGRNQALEWPRTGVIDQEATALIATRFQSRSKRPLPRWRLGSLYLRAL